MNKNKGFFASLIAIVFLIVIDQITKILAMNFLSKGSGINVIPGVFQFYYLENKGAAFGMMENKQIVFIIFALVMFGAAVYLLAKIPSGKHYRVMRACAVMIAAGAIGNMIDRIWHHYVVDFVYISAIDFPVFNIADCYVCIAAVVIVIAFLTIYKNEEFEFLK